MSTTLCIVDVQPAFSASRKIVDEVVREIKLARRRKAGIVVLEYYGHDSSAPKVREALRGYNRCVTMKKYEDDGSDETIEAMKKNPGMFGFERIRVCGVNACYCVFETATGLKSSGLFGRVEVSRSATSCSHTMAKKVCVPHLIEKIKACPKC